MGRTVLPFSQVLLHEQEQWQKFRRALRREDQDAFDELFNMAKFHAAAAAYSSRTLPMESIFMAMLLEHHKAVRILQARVTELEQRLSSPW